MISNRALTVTNRTRGRAACERNVLGSELYRSVCDPVGRCSRVDIREAPRQLSHRRRTTYYTSPLQHAFFTELAQRNRATLTIIT